MKTKKYMIQVNIEKQPEIYHALENKKKTDSVSRYIRDLILKDIGTAGQSNSSNNTYQINGIE